MNVPKFSIEGGKPMTAAEFVGEEISNAPDYYAGELEQLKAKLAKQESFIRTIINLMPAKLQRQLIVAHTCSSVEEV